MKKKLLTIGMILVMLLLALLVACTKPCEHELEPKWDEVNHWQECKLCGEKQDEAAHVLTWVSTDATNHWQACECGYTTTPVAHADGEDADELCDACGRNLHAHVYAWTSDAENHWEECACGDKKEATAHVDVKNNETEAEEADGKCDVCNREIYVVTFDMQGHGAETAVQNVAKGGHAATPATPADDDAWKFGGWYKEATCENAFDFATEVINAATTVYAKWTEDTTEGASKKYAYVLTLDEESLQDIEQNQVVYFAYTAEAANRYTVSIAVGLQCTFTTDKAEGTYDYDNAAYFDLAVGETVYVALTCVEELEEGSKASVILAVCTDEPLPEDVFPTGFYVNDTYTVEFNHQAKEAILNGNTYSPKYIGGSINTLTFVQEMTISGKVYKTTYALKITENGSYQLIINNATKSPYSLLYIAPQDPIDVATFSGVYVPNDEESMADAMTEISIYPDGSGFIRQSGYKYDYAVNQGAYFNQQLNMLTLGQYSITLNFDGENVVSINITGGGISEAITYARSEKELLPKILPLEYTEYNGKNISLYKDDYSDGHRWNSSYYGYPVEITAYDKESDIYTVKNGSTIYQLKIEGTLIKLCNEDGEEYDTLVPFAPVFHEIPVGGVNETINSSDFLKNLYWYKATKEGWYNIVVSGEGTNVYYKVNEKAPANTYNAKKVGTMAVRLEVGTIVAIDITSCYPAPESVTVTITSTAEPAGLREDNPLDLVDGKATMTMDNENTYYFRYASLPAGTYAIGCTYESYGMATSILFVINGEKYGFDNNSWKYYGGVTSEFPYAIITIAETTDLIIAANRKGAYGDADVTASVTRDYRPEATEITADAGTLEAGIYKIADFTGFDNIIITTSEGETTLTQNDIQLGFVLDTQANYVINYVLGAEKNPIIITELGTTEVNVGQYVMITAPADKDVLLALGSSYDTEFCFTYNGEHYGYHCSDGLNFEAYDKTTLIIAAGETVKVHVSCEGYPYVGTVPVYVAEDYTKNYTEIEFVNGTPANGKLPATATVSENGVYYVESSFGSNVTVTSSASFTIVLLPSGQELVVTEKEGVYSATISASTKSYFKVVALEESITLTIEFNKGSEVYPDEIEVVEGTATKFSLPVRANYYISLKEGTYSFYYTASRTVEIHLNGQVYTMARNNKTIIVVNEGDVLMLVGDQRYPTSLAIEVVKPLVVEPIEGKVIYGAKLFVSGQTTEFVITASEDFSEVVLSISSEDDSPYNLNVTAIDENNYKFTYIDQYYDTDGECYGTIELNGNNLLLTINWINQDLTLAKLA